MHTVLLAILLLTSMCLIFLGIRYSFRAQAKKARLPKRKLFECLSTRQQEKRQEAYTEIARLKRHGCIDLSISLVLSIATLFM